MSNSCKLSRIPIQTNKNHDSKFENVSKTLIFFSIEIQREQEQVYGNTASFEI